MKIELKIKLIVLWVFGLMDLDILFGSNFKYLVFLLIYRSVNLDIDSEVYIQDEFILFGI